MNRDSVRNNFLNSYTEENRKKRSCSIKKQMNNILKTDIDKFLWSKKISKGTKKKWLSRTKEEKEKIISDINIRRQLFLDKLTNPIYKYNHIKKILCSGKIKETKPEKQLKVILELNNIKYIHQYQLKNKVYDFYLPKFHLLIETDGVYWHGKGLQKHQMNDMQKKHKKNDINKNILAKSLGYNLERFWENEIEENKILKKINKYE